MEFQELCTISSHALKKVRQKRTVEKQSLSSEEENPKCFFFLQHAVKSGKDPLFCNYTQKS